MLDNDGIIPTNIGLDGKIGSAAGGKWYGGVYGWGFTVEVPQTGQLAHRNTHYLGLAGFGNAYLLTGDDRWLDPWRKMIDKINAQGKNDRRRDDLSAHVRRQGLVRLHAARNTSRARRRSGTGRCGTTT